MFEGKTANEAMYRAINFELASEIKLALRDELTEDRLTTIQKEQQKSKELATKNIEYKKLMIERDEMKKEMESISVIVGRITDKWKDDAVMQSFEKNLASWKKRPSVLIAFLLENIEKLTHRLEKEELEDRPLRKGILATLGKDVNILEPLWNDMQDSIMDGEWHAFSEANEIIMRHGYRQLTIGRIKQIRQAYFKFAKDDEFHTVRGGKDYLFEWKRTDNVYKFCFTPVGEEVEPEKPVEKKDVLLKVEKRLRIEALATVNNTRILEPIWNDMQDSVIDGKWHAFSEVDEIIRNHGYRKQMLGSIQQKRGAYLRFAKDEGYYTARGEKDYMFDRKMTDGVHKFRFTPVGEEVEPEKKVEKGLELGRTVERISDHAIRENPRDEFIMLFCDDKWHTFSEPVEMFKKYDRYNRYKQSAFPALRCAYMAHVQELYQKIKKREGGTHKFKFEKKRVEAETVQLQNAVKCARCGMAIRPTEKTHQIGNLFYHHDCYEAML